MRGSPELAALAHELLAAVGTHPSLSRRMINRHLGCQMPFEAHDGQVPANTYRARAKLAPVIIEHRRMFQREPRLVALSRDLDFDPADPTPKLPRRGKLTGWSAS